MDVDTHSFAENTAASRIVRFADMSNNLDKETVDKVSFVTFIIGEFASAYKMSGQDAYRYLKHYGGLKYVLDCWWALHIDNPFWTVRDIYKVCRGNGGYR